jgi:GDPmannose 4,6-dehydratase
MRSNSVLSYTLYTISALGYMINNLYTFRNEKKVQDPLSERSVTIGTAKFSSNKIDEMLLSGALNYELKDEGIVIETNKREFKMRFDESRFRPSEVPILLSNTEKIKKELSVHSTKQIHDIINDQINYYFDRDRRLNVI